jgi:predicted  nucleic acid-binding Zn-ribbon protein
MNSKRMALAGAGILAAAGIAIGAASLANAAGSTEIAGYSGQPGAGYGAPNGAPGGGGSSGGESRGGAPNGNTDPSKPMRSDEQLLTGDTAAKVNAAAKAKEPNATIERVETDSDGVYEAHMVRADGTHIIVQVDASFAVTNVQEMGQGGPGDHSGQGSTPGGRQGGSSGGAETPTPSSSTTT